MNIKTKISEALHIVWLFFEPPVFGELYRRCIVVGRFKKCHRAFIYDGVCSYHWNIGRGND